ncbi:MAG TPA: ABC transporter permease [Ktedonobacteraceae bacterium]|nr:ABC transporter permease [Ktedonobacteraceae bacterium]
MTQSKPAILAERLEKWYGKTHALRGLDLVAEEGTVLGALGPNGAGKERAMNNTITRTISDLTRNLFVVAVMWTVGLIVGFRPQGSPIGQVAAAGLLLLTSFSFSWISATIGLAVRSVEAAQSAGFIWLFPLTFASSAFVPTQAARFRPAPARLADRRRRARPPAQPARCLDHLAGHRLVHRYPCRLHPTRRAGLWAPHFTLASGAERGMLYDCFSSFSVAFHAC